LQLYFDFEVRAFNQLQKLFRRQVAATGTGIEKIDRIDFSQAPKKT